jgi:formamidopyrimidine-DNA glycosylase
MPEFPEVQALAERLAEAIGAAPLTAITTLSFSGLKTFDPPPESLAGRTLASANAYGKYVVMDFGGPRLMFHLSQGGRVDVETPAKSTKPKGAVMRMRFGDSLGILLKEFGTERKAGWWVLAPGDDGPLVTLGPDPFSAEFEERVLHGEDGRRIHTWLRDQRTVRGIGRGYSDDILHRAHLSPYATLNQLDEAQRRDLLATIRAVLTEALEYERTRTGGLPTKLGERFRVHGRFGTPCPECGDDLRRVSYESHEVTYCPRCQTGCKVLADRRLSRLVR